MKIKKYFAADMRAAMKAIRDEQGPDAIILSNRSLPEGVEITVAIDYDESLASAPIERSPAAAVANGGVQGFRELLARREAPATGAPAAGDAAVNEELRTLRRMLETQLAALAWNDLTRRAPLSTELLRELTEIGFTRDVAARTADALPPGVDFTAARRLAIARIADQVRTTGDRWGEFGGVVAMVGPAGAGKSSVLAKLAARWTMRHGARDLVLINTDAERVGAGEETAGLARMLGCRVYDTPDMADLPSVLARVARARLVLIDTAGCTARDARLRERVESLAECAPDVEFALTLSASTQAAAIEEAVMPLAGRDRIATVLTRLDECTSLGGALSALIRAQLPVSYASEGRRVPDDLRVARSLDLVSTAVLLAEKLGATADEELLTRRFHGVINGRA